MRRNYRCSSALLQRVLYGQLELKRRMRQYPWPTKIGIDEHLFKHEPKLNQRRFVTMVVDHKNKRLMEVVHGKSADELRAALDHIPGRENVRWVARADAPRDTVVQWTYACQRPGNECFVDSDCSPDVSYPGACQTGPTGRFCYP